MKILTTNLGNNYNQYILKKEKTPIQTLITLKK